MELWVNLSSPVSRATIHQLLLMRQPSHQVRRQDGPAARTHSHDRAGPWHNSCHCPKPDPSADPEASRHSHPTSPKGTFVSQQCDTAWGAAGWLWGWHPLIHCLSLLLPQVGLGTQLLASRVAVGQCCGDNGPTVVTVLDHVYACSIQKQGKARVPGLNLGNLCAAPTCREWKGIP